MKPTGKGRLRVGALIFCLSWALAGWLPPGAHPATAACGDDTLDPGESCDDGNLASGDGCSAECRLEPRDRLQCYRIRQMQEQATTTRRKVILSDRFESGATKLRKPAMFCTAADTNQEGILDARAYLTCYRMPPLGGRQRGHRRTVLIGNELGARVLRAKRARHLCVPSVPLSGLFPILVPCGDARLDAGEECDDGNTADGDGCSARCRLEPAQRYMCHRSKPTRQSPRLRVRDVSVADGLQSILMKTVRSVRFCAPAELDGSGVQDPSAYLECFKVRPTEGRRKPLKIEVTAQSEFGVDSFTVLDARVLCIPSSEPASLKTPSRDPVKCYSAKRAKDTPRFEKRTVTLSDRFETKNTQIISPVEICSPAEVDATPLIDPTAHLTCYRINQLSGQPGFKKRDLVVHNAFGTQTLSLDKAKLECVPSEIPPVASSPTVDRLKCYSARITKGTPSFDTGKVRIADRFETKRAVVREPALFCTPVDQDAEGTRDPAASLTCFSISDAAGQPGFSKREIRPQDEFGETTLTVSRASTLCLPSITVFEK